MYSRSKPCDNASFKKKIDVVYSFYIDHMNFQIRNISLLTPWPSTYGATEWISKCKALLMRIHQEIPDLASCASRTCCSDPSCSGLLVLRRAIVRISCHIHVAGVYALHGRRWVYNCTTDRVMIVFEGHTFLGKREHEVLFYYSWTIFSWRMCFILLDSSSQGQCFVDRGFLVGELHLPFGRVSALSCGAGHNSLAK